MDKPAWRRWARDHRPLDVDQPAIVRAVAQLLRHRPPGWIVTYRPLPHEVDLAGLELDPGLGPFALTRTPDEGRDLTLHRAGGPIERHRWGYDQPAPDAPVVPLHDVAVVLVPGLAFDRRGHRLGHGLGYYDRFLARLPDTAWRVGVVPAALVVDELPADDHDVPMTHLVTEGGVTTCPGG